MRASKSSSATSSQRECEFCSSLGSILPVFKFTDARLRGGHGGVGAEAWRRARARGDRRRLPTPFRRKTKPTAKPPPVLVVENIFLADWDLTQKRDETRDADLRRPGAERSGHPLREKGNSADRCWIELAPTDPRDSTRKRDKTRDADLRRPGAAEFNPRSPRWSPRRSTDLESRP